MRRGATRGLKRGLRRFRAFRVSQTANSRMSLWTFLSASSTSFTSTDPNPAKGLAGRSRAV